MNPSRSARPGGLPYLDRLGFDYVSERRQDFYDWGDEGMTPQELRDLLLAERSLRLLPE